MLCYALLVFAPFLAPVWLPFGIIWAAFWTLLGNFLAPVLAPVWQHFGSPCKIAFMPAVVAKSGPLGRVRPEPAWERKERSLCTLSAHLKVLNMSQMDKQKNCLCWSLLVFSVLCLSLMVFDDHCWFLLVLLVFDGLSCVLLLFCSLLLFSSLCFS